MCDKTVRRGPFPLQYVLNWFVTQQQVKIWHDNSDDHDKNRLIEWYDSYTSVLKLHVEKELMPIAWHPSRWRNWCVSEDEKNDTEKLWA